MITVLRASSHLVSLRGCVCVSGCRGGGDLLYCLWGLPSDLMDGRLDQTITTPVGLFLFYCVNLKLFAYYIIPLRSITSDCYG